MQSNAPGPEAAAAAPKKSGRRPFIVLFILASLVSGVVFGYRYLYADQQTTDDAQVESDLVAVAPRIAGVVREIKVKSDQMVEAGQVLIELDPADLDAKIKIGEAELAAAQAQAGAADAQVSVVEATTKGGLSSAKASLSGSASGVKSADAQIAVANASLKRAQTELTRTETELSRTKELRSSGATPQSSLDSAQTSYDAAQASVESALAQISAAQDAKRVAQSRVAEASGRVDQSDPEVQIAAAKASAALAHARIKSAEANLEATKLQRSYTEIKAAQSGWISHISSNEGQFIQAGQAVAQIIPKETYIVANFKETQIAKIKAGQHVEIEIDAFPGQHWEGTVATLSRGTGARFSLLPPDNASGNFVKVVQRVPIKIIWDDPEAALELRAGLSATVTVFTGQPPTPTHLASQ